MVTVQERVDRLIHAGAGSGPCGAIPHLKPVGRTPRDQDPSPLHRVVRMGRLFSGSAPGKHESKADHALRHPEAVLAVPRAVPTFSGRVE